jgi:hypothetical protein
LAGRSPGRSRSTRRTPFFPALQAGLADLGGDRLPGVAELRADGPELFSHGDIDRSLDQLTHELFDLGSELFQDHFDALVARRLRRRGLDRLGHDRLPASDREGFAQITLR